MRVKRVVQLSRTTSMRRFGKFVERRARRTFEACLDVVWPVSVRDALPADEPIRKVLFVRPNFRIGNIVLATAWLPALHARFPSARIDYLVGDSMASLLEGLPIAHVYQVSRQFIVAPWRFVALFLRLRREHFDLAIDGGMGSYSGALYGFLSGARQRLGFAGRGDRFLTVRLPRPSLKSAYEAAAAFARALGVTCPTQAIYSVSAAEDAAAVERLHGLGLRPGGAHERFLAVFVGGHLEKRWPPQNWLELVERLAAEAVPVVVFVGPEETGFIDTLRSAAQPSVHVVPPDRLRAFAALLSHATLLVTADSGPMHLAVALGIPTLTLLQQERSRYYVPRGPDDRALFRPTCADVMAVLHAHPRWALLCPQHTAAPAPTGTGTGCDADETRPR
jgi:heptosyltransferase-3